MQSGGDRGQLSDGMGEELRVLGYARVALNETLGEIINENSKRMIGRFESLWNVKHAH